MPLIDMVPSDPSTRMTAMQEAKKLTLKSGQNFTVFTADQQLYRVMLNVIWAYPEKFVEFIPGLGGMHMLMSFIGCVGSLMADTGLEELMKAAFGGVEKMLSGKKFLQNFRALRIVGEELLRTIVEGGVDGYDDLTRLLEDRASRSKKAWLWIQNMLKPLFIMLLFVPAEREGDWPLHLAAVKSMLPYFFAA
jgi:hypothetical protein